MYEVNTVQCYVKSHQPMVQAKDIHISLYSPHLSEESAALILFGAVSGSPEVCSAITHQLHLL